MKVTTKGRVTIPHEIRRQLGLSPGAEVEFKIDGDAILMLPVRDRSSVGTQLVNRMRGTANERMTTDEILALTRGNI
jgi:AbrB family looped-hinge helix DNA binding protein